MPKQSPPTSLAKRVAYLWGAGATQAEIDYRGGSGINLLMGDNNEHGEGVASRIISKLAPVWAARFAADKGTDIEKLISLCASCNVPQYATVAERLRALYFEDICQHLDAAGVLGEPTLATALFLLHANPAFANIERLTGIITTNHDGLLQFAGQQINGAVNLGIPFLSSHLRPRQDSLAPLIQLHGSFSWRYADPIRIRPLRANTRYASSTVWIPPTTTKDSKHYPFNKLAAIAYELLARQCDVLRVVGASLTQNDWHVLSMIFTAQRHAEHRHGHAFKIELIMPLEAGNAVVNSCSFFKRLIPINHLSDGAFAEYDDEDAIASNAEMRNPLFYWLKQKILFHYRRGELGAAPLSGTLAVVAGEST